MEHYVMIKGRPVTARLIIAKNLLEAKAIYQKNVGSLYYASTLDQLVAYQRPTLREWAKQN